MEGRSIEFHFRFHRLTHPCRKRIRHEGIDARRRFVDRAVRMGRDMRVETEARPGRGRQDPLRDIEIAALMAEASGNNDDLKGVLLDLADMIRTSMTVLDAKAEVSKGKEKEPSPTVLVFWKRRTTCPSKIAPNPCLPR